MRGRPFLVGIKKWYANPFPQAPWRVGRGYSIFTRDSTTGRYSWVRAY